MSTDRCEVVVIGGGLAGITCAHYLAVAGAEVQLVDREHGLTEHSTGRSAAHFVPSYGGAAARNLALQSFEMITTDRSGLFDEPVLNPRPMLWIDHCQGPSAQHDASAGIDPTDASPIGIDEAVALCPALRPSAISRALIDRGCYDVDVAGLHQAYVRGARLHGASLHVDDRVVRIERAGTRWRVHMRSRSVECRIVVNAAGAWADEIAELADIGVVGLRALRRTLFTSRIGEDQTSWPFVHSLSDAFYFKPESGGQLLCSPCDATECSPGSPTVDELDVALAIDVINAVTTLNIRTVHTAWAGLRVFSSDQSPVVGEDADAPGFFWCAGQGGTGIQIAPATGRLLAELITGTHRSGDTQRAALLTALSPHRLIRSPRRPLEV